MDMAQGPKSSVFVVNSLFTEKEKCWPFLAGKLLCCSGLLEVNNKAMPGTN